MSQKILTLEIENGSEEVKTKRKNYPEHYAICLRCFCPVRFRTNNHIPFLACTNGHFIQELKWQYRGKEFQL